MQPKSDSFNARKEGRMKIKRLVVDASVASAAGGAKAVFPTSVNCRDFLLAFQELDHKVVMSKDILGEWRKHESGFSRRWRATMVAKKRVYPIKQRIIDATLRGKINAAKLRKRDCTELLKDCILIEAAIKTDKSVISLDETARILFAKLSNEISRLKIILWVNPDKTEDKAVAWLEAGAKNEEERLLGRRSD